MNRKRFVSVLLAGALLLTGAMPAYATGTDQAISDAKAKKQEAQSGLANVEQTIANLESLKGNQEAYLAELNAQYTELNASVTELAEKAQKKQDELELVKKALKDAQKDQEKQYENMKVRIAYMYENSQGSYLEMLFSADSFVDFLNRAENISKISEYDREMLQKYMQAVEKVEDQKQAVKIEQEQIQLLQEESTAKRNEVDALIDATQGQIAAYASQISDSESEAGALLAQINSQTQQIDSLLVQAEEEAEAAQQAAAAEQAVQEETSASQEPQEPETEAAPESTDEPSEEPEYEEPLEPETPQEPQEPEAENSGSSGTYLGNFKLTSYCNCSQCCGSWAGGPTASGVMPVAGRTVAMAGLPFGTKLLINGNVYVVEDLGTPYGHVDIYAGSHAEALSFGLQYADVYQLN